MWTISTSPRDGLVPRTWTTLVTQVKTKCFDIGPKIHTETKIFNCFDGGYGFPVQITTPTGCLTGLGAIFTRGLVGGSYGCGCTKLLKWLSALNFDFNFCIEI